jgi:hypothetical protein
VLDPEREVLQFLRTVDEHWRRVRALVEPLTSEASWARGETQLKRSALYRELVRVALYARGDISGSAEVSATLARLTPLLQAPLLPPRDMSAVLGSIDPDDEHDPMRLLLAAAVARAVLDAGTSAITSSQLAILAGVTRRHVGAEIREGRLEAEIEGRRGTAGAALIRPDEARRWLQNRGGAKDSP